MGKPRKPSMAAQLIGLGGQQRDRNALRDRVQERERREALDDRSEIEKLLGDPPRSRSALANRSHPK
jgi:hypothetical protein